MYMTNEWTNQKVMAFFENVSGFDDFLEQGKGKLRFKIKGLDLIIYKEDIGGKFYYVQPFDEQVSYSEVGTFMTVAIPWISKEIEKRRHEKLMYGCGNVKKAEIK